MFRMQGSRLTSHTNPAKFWHTRQDSNLHAEDVLVYYTVACLKGVNIMNCINCEKETSNPKFCSSACAAKHNNKNRKRTKESKLKTSEAVKLALAASTKVKAKSTRVYSKTYVGAYTRIWLKTCCCGTSYWSKVRKGKYCPLCRTAKRIKNGIRSIHGTHEGTHVDSSWEVIVLIQLNKMGALWERPQPVPYTIKGKQRNYYPDFYLPDYDLYLDPKNPYRMLKDKEKLTEVTKKINLVYGDVNLVLAHLKGLEPSCIQINLSTGS